MTFELNEEAVGRELKLLIDDPGFRRGVDNLCSDPFLLAFFLMSTSQGEGMGEAGVAAIRQDEVAQLLRDLDKQEAEERGHKEGTYEIALELFPDQFENGRYLYPDALTGKVYYLTVLNENRARLKSLDRYSRLNLFLTTSFGYEVMVLLLYRAIIDGLKRSRLPDTISGRARRALEKILEEEEGHLEIVDQHNELLSADRRGLSAEACAMLGKLGSLDAEDYRWCAERAVRQILTSYEEYQHPAALKARIVAAKAA